VQVRVQLGAASTAGRPPDTDHWSGVAIDVLRATTTLIVALDHGAGAVVPLETPEAARALRDRSHGVLACGERDGRIVPGFDLGNSPFEYERERVEGRTLAFASTNGSHALKAIERCRVRRLAAFINASATASSLLGEERIWIVCAGKLGQFSMEDAACAGFLCARLAEHGATLDGAAARLALSLAPRDRDEVRAVTEGSDHGRYLASLGPEFARDVAFSGTLDQLPRVTSF
jgi:2-phosphosulfolactate phosphatase